MNEVYQAQTGNPVKRDYSLTGHDAQTAVANGLATAEWYHSYIPRQTMKELMRRTDGPALRDTVLWVALLVLFGYGAAAFWAAGGAFPSFLPMVSSMAPRAIRAGMKAAMARPS